MASRAITAWPNCGQQLGKRYSNLIVRSPIWHSIAVYPWCLYIITFSTFKHFTELIWMCHSYTIVYIFTVVSRQGVCVLHSMCTHFVCDSCTNREQMFAGRKTRQVAFAVVYQQMYTIWFPALPWQAEFHLTTHVSFPLNCTVCIYVLCMLLLRVKKDFH